MKQSEAELYLKELISKENIKTKCNTIGELYDACRDRQLFKELKEGIEESQDISYARGMKEAVYFMKYFNYYDYTRLFSRSKHQTVKNTLKELQKIIDKI